MKINRKEIKRQARHVVKKHYLLLVALCLVAAAIGTEFTGSLDFLKIPSGKPVAIPSSNAVVAGQPTLGRVVVEALDGKAEESKETAKAIRDQAIRNTEEHSGAAVLGRSRGVLAYLVNEVSSGALIATVITAVQSILGSVRMTWIVFIILSVLLLSAVNYLFFNIYIVISRRVFLESRIYERVPIQRLVYLLRVKKWLKVSWTMFVVGFFQFLWMFTIIGGMIKYYAYFLVPYIVAENPDISAKQAIRLSQDMMKGHKWECFVLELSYIGWDLLGGITFGISKIFYSNPYQVAAYCEYYAELRKAYIEEQKQGYELLNDRYLFERADQWELLATYGDIILGLEDSIQEEKNASGFWGFLENVFGVVPAYTEDEERYQENENRKLQMMEFQDAAEGRAYPGRLFAIPEHLKRKKLETIHYLRHYSVGSLILMFFLFSMIGWLWEVCLNLIMAGQFVNRGVLHGPWLPIYGTGGILILTILNYFRKKPVMECWMIAVLCGSVEYLTGTVLEWLHHGEKWWDYSGYFLNLHGRICAEGLLVFSIGGMAIVYVLAPMLDHLLKRLPKKAALIVCIVLLSAFTADVAYSGSKPNVGEGITDYRVRVEERRMNQAFFS